MVPTITVVAPVKIDPLIVTFVPASPKAGVNDVIFGTSALVTVKSVELVAVLIGVVMLILPVVAVGGTIAVTCVFESTVKLVAAVVLNLTAEAPHRFDPVIVTEVPTGPVVGLNEPIDAAR